MLLSLPLLATAWSQPRSCHARLPLTCEALHWPRAASDRPPVKIVDAFAFNGEWDMLELRRRELAAYINATAIVTSGVNFHGQPRPEPHVTVDSVAGKLTRLSLPPSAFSVCSARLGSPRNRAECRLAVSKNSVALAVDRVADIQASDWVLFSDPDELPLPAVLRLLHTCEPPVAVTTGRGAKVADAPATVVIKLTAIAHYLYHVGCVANTSLWYGARGPFLVRVGTMRRYGLRAFQFEPKKYRGWGVYNGFGPYASAYDYQRTQLLIPCAAWHMSSFGGAPLVAKKVRDNKDRAHEPSSSDVRHCREAGNRDRQGLVVTPRRPARAYPDVPASAHSDPRRFAVFFEAPSFKRRRQLSARRDEYGETEKRAFDSS